MVREFELPDVGEGVAEGEIVRWLVEPGDEVSEDQAVAEVETDKAVVEVPSPVDGVVEELRAEEAEVVPVGTVIITFAVEGEDTDEAREAAGSGNRTEPGRGPAEISGEPAVTRSGEGSRAAGSESEDAPTASRRVFAAPSARRLARELGIDVASVEGSGPGGRVAEADVRAAAEGEAGTGAATDEPTTESEPVEGGEPPEPAASGTETGSAGRERTLAAPATRRIAREREVDLDAVPAVEERNGEAFVTPEAVMEYAEAQRQAQATDAAAAGEREAGPREEREPYRGIRRTIGRRMEASKFTAPHVTHHDTVEVERLIETREELRGRAEDRGVRLTYLPFVIKAVVAALEEFPYLNGSLDEDREEIVVKNHYDIGIAVATDAGLMVPVVEGVDGKGILQLASEANELAQRARERSISREEMQGGTFTITNFGAIGGEYATPIINHPETAILGLGRLEQRPVAENGSVYAAHTLPLSLSIDHRVVDGAEAARFTNALKEYLRNPMLLLLE